MPDADWEKNENMNNNDDGDFKQQPGPVIDNNPGDSALDYFPLYFEDELLQNIID